MKPFTRLLRALFRSPRPEPLQKCDGCDHYLPKSQMIAYGPGYFCTEACAQLHLHDA
jgi:hypothetical protein